MSDGKIRHFRIHPAIGLARLGDANRKPKEGCGWFLGPERPTALVNAVPGGIYSLPFKQGDRVMSQGVRFRVFEYRDGASMEIAPGDRGHDVEKITWHVHLANRKAAFFQFWGPLGRGSLYGTPLQRFSWLVRNRRVPRAERDAKLVLNSGIQSIGSDIRETFVNLCNVNSHTRDFIDFLGQLLIDAEGHLIVLGGRGKSLFVPALHPGVQEARSLTTYANNDGWFDDIADGPVSATLHFRNGQTQEIEKEDGAWLVSAPPDFAPGVRPVRSMWDTLVDVFVRNGTPSLEQDLTHRGGTAAQLAAAWDRKGRKLRDDFRPSFTRTIFPILSAAGQLVNSHNMPSRSMAHRGFTDAYMGSLGGPMSDSALRHKIFERIRSPGKWKYDTALMPLAHGDLYFDATPDSPLWRRILHRVGQVPGRLLTVTKLQYALLQKWDAGCFEADWAGDLNPTTGPISPAGLDEAALREASGGAFVPGIECGWLLTSPEMYAGPFRLARHRVLTQKTYVGAIDIRPGIISAQMALPWQADFADCKQEPVIGELVQVAWWPSQRPDDVLRGGSEDRQNLGWVAWAPDQDTISDDSDRFHGMVDHWSEFDFIANRADGSIGRQ
jgi:hypothetical protein